MMTAVLPLAFEIRILSTSAQVNGRTHSIHRSERLERNEEVIAPGSVREVVTAGKPEEIPEVSVIMPCLNEADTLGVCIEKARNAMSEAGIRGEIIVADNGSADGSPEIAARMGARLVSVAARGYGSALMAGIASARGKYIVMGDADSSYDFRELPRFIEKLREGYDLVQGCRLKSGGGRVEHGAMPLLHRWLGNPLFSSLARWWFGSTIHDIHCGMRGFTRDLYRSLDLQCTGMEFASEMIIKSTLRQSRIVEIPIVLQRDGRRSHAPHLRTFRDGWRHLRFYLIYSPRWLFLVPGLLLISIGLLAYALGMPGVTIRGVTLDVHTVLFGSLAIIAGYQSILFAVFTKVFAITEGLLPQDRRLTWMFQRIDLEKGLIAGVTTIAAGVLLLLVAINQWRTRHFGDLDYRVTMRWVIPGVTLTTLGIQTILSSFFLSILGMRRR